MGRHPLDHVCLFAELKRVFGEPNDTEFGIVRTGPAIFFADRHPDLKRVLCSDVVKPECGKEADHAFRDTPGRFGERVKFGDEAVGGYVEAAPGFDDKSPLFGKTRYCRAIP